MAAVTKQVDVQWSQIDGIMVCMPHNGGFFSAVTKLRGDSSYQKCHGIRFPPMPAAEQGTGRRAGSRYRGVRLAAIREDQEAAGCMREKPFSGT